MLFLRPGGGGTAGRKPYDRCFFGPSLGSLSKRFGIGISSPDSSLTELSSSVLPKRSVASMNRAR